jgi:3',5'-cyclic AMP phosphodiesterase CpdA
VRFFVLDSDYLDQPQVQWLESQLKASTDEWKIPYFHHPLYSSGGRHGSETDLRLTLEPLFVKYGVSVVFSGHDHIYERTKPQKGITYFVSGSAGQLRRGDLEQSTLTASGYDQDQTFMIVEVAGNTMYVQAITRTGQTVDSATIERRSDAASAAGQP